MAEKEERRGRPKGSKDKRPRRRHIRAKGEEVLSHLEWLTVEYFMRGYSKKDAMIAAGYSESTASALAYQIFGRPRVQKEIDRRRAQTSKLTAGMADRIQEELARIAFFNIGHFLRIDDDGLFVYDFEEATMDDLAAVGQVTVVTRVEGEGKERHTVKEIKVKPYDKKAALDSLARIHGMFQDNLNLTADGDSLESRLAKGRARIAQGATVDGEAERID